MKFDKINVVWMIILSFITLGIYVPIWFLRIKKVFDNLDTKQKISKGLIINFFVFTILELVFMVLFFIPGSLIFQGSMYLLTNISSFIGLVLLLVLAFKVRSLLEELADTELSGAATFFFTIFYLQNKINSLQK